MDRERSQCPRFPLAFDVTNARTRSELVPRLSPCRRTGRLVLPAKTTPACVGALQPRATEFGTWGMFFLLFPERDMRAINQRWTEVAKDLHQFGYIPRRPDFGGPHGEKWKTLLAWRSGLIHGKVSRPDAANLEPEQLAVPTRDELRECKPGWAVRIATERIRRLHVAAGTDPPDWLVNV